MALRHIDSEHVRPATKFWVTGSDETDGGIPIIRLRDRCFGVHCDGYMAPFAFLAEVRGRLFNSPISLRGGTWTARREEFLYYGAFPEVEGRGSAGKLEYVGLHAGTLGNHFEREGGSTAGCIVLEPVSVAIV